MLVVASAGMVSAQNFISNGTFDSAVPLNGTGGSWTNFDISAGGWFATGGNPGGRFILNDSGQATNPTIQQTITGLTIGQSYTVLGGYQIHVVGLGNAANSFGVLLDNAAILQLGNPGNVWTPFSVDFVATSTSHLIGFEAERLGSDLSYMIDNIAVVAAVPEPGTVALISLVAGGASLAEWRYRLRRRHKSLSRQ